MNTMQFMGIAISPTDPDFVIGGTQDNGLRRFTDSLGWTLPEGGDGGDVIMDPFDPNRMWRANPVGSFGVGAYVRRSTDGGSTWTSIVTWHHRLGRGRVLSADGRRPGHAKSHFLGTNGSMSAPIAARLDAPPRGHVYFSPTNCVDRHRPGLGRARSMSVAAHSADGTANAYRANQLFVTTNNGATWTERTPQLGGDFEAFAVDPKNSNIAYVVSANFSPTGDNIWKTTDAGQTWTSLSATCRTRPSTMCCSIPVRRIATPTICSTWAAISASTARPTSATSWTKFGNGLAVSQVRDLEFSPQTQILAAATHGRGSGKFLTAPPAGQIFGTVYQRHQFQRHAR